MKSIENFSIGAIKIFISTIENVLFLPGINLVDDRLHEKLLQHSAFTNYLKDGILAEKFRQDEIKQDDRTNLAYIDEKGEMVPVSQAVINNAVKPVLGVGTSFKLNELTERKIPVGVANRIVRFCPSEGWVDAQHVIDVLELTGKDADKVKDLF